jgi:hypothetical protein
MREASSRVEATQDFYDGKKKEREKETFAGNKFMMP